MKDLEKFSYRLIGNNDIVIETDDVFDLYQLAVEAAYDRLDVVEQIYSGVSFKPEIFVVLPTMEENY